MSFPRIHKGPMMPKTLENYQEAFCMPEIFQVRYFSSTIYCVLFFFPTQIPPPGARDSETGRSKWHQLYA